MRALLEPIPYCKCLKGFVVGVFPDAPLVLLARLPAVKGRLAVQAEMQLALGAAEDTVAFVADNEDVVTADAWTARYVLLLLQ